MFLEKITIVFERTNPTPIDINGKPYYLIIFELWGLIACHNYTPRFIDYKSREYSKLIGQILSSALEFRQDEEKLQEEQQFKINVEQLAKQLMHGEDIASLLTTNVVSILSIIKASGAVLVYDKKIYKLGITPDDEQLLGLMKWINETVTEPLYYTEKLSIVCPEALHYKGVASGIIRPGHSWGRQRGECSVKNAI